MALYGNITNQANICDQGVAGGVSLFGGIIGLAEDPNIITIIPDRPHYVGVQLLGARALHFSLRGWFGGRSLPK